MTTPFHPAQMTKERLSNAKKLKLVLTAGIGSDHIDLQAAADNNLTVAEVQGENLLCIVGPAQTVAEAALAFSLLIRSTLSLRIELCIADKMVVVAMCASTFLYCPYGVRQVRTKLCVSREQQYVGSRG